MGCYIVHEWYVHQSLNNIDTQYLSMVCNLGGYTCLSNTKLLLCVKSIKKTRLNGKIVTHLYKSWFLNQKQFLFWFSELYFIVDGILIILDRFLFSTVMSVKRNKEFFIRRLNVKQPGAGFCLCYFRNLELCDFMFFFGELILTNRRLRCWSIHTKITLLAQKF